MILGLMSSQRRRGLFIKKGKTKSLVSGEWWMERRVGMLQTVWTNVEGKRLRTK